MRCGTKQFIVTYERAEGEERDEKIIYARTPAEARKNLRQKCGKETIIYRVKEK